MRSSHVLVLLVGLSLGALLGPSRAQDLYRRRDLPDVSAIRDAAIAAGLPCCGVSCSEGKVSIRLDDSATKAQREDARALEQAADGGLRVFVLRGQPLDLHHVAPLSVVDALAVLAVRPDDQGARQVVEEHAKRVLEERDR